MTSCANMGRALWGNDRGGGRSGKSDSQPGNEDSGHLDGPDPSSLVTQRL